MKPYSLRFQTANEYRSGDFAGKSFVYNACKLIIILDGFLVKVWGLFGVLAVQNTVRNIYFYKSMSTS